jgi:hypothetical protein
LLFVDEYNYLGVILDEFWEFKKKDVILAGSCSRALGANIVKYKKLANMGKKLTPSVTTVVYVQYSTMGHTSGGI